MTSRALPPSRHVRAINSLLCVALRASPTYRVQVLCTLNVSLPGAATALLQAQSSLSLGCFFRASRLKLATVLLVAMTFCCLLSSCQADGQGQLNTSGT